jgi:hypothetical protein
VCESCFLDKIACSSSYSVETSMVNELEEVSSKECICLGRVSTHKPVLLSKTFSRLETDSKCMFTFIFLHSHLALKGFLTLTFLTIDKL